MKALLALALLLYQTADASLPPLSVQNQGSTVAPLTYRINFSGAGVVATASGGVVTATISGSGSTLALTPLTKSSNYTVATTDNYIRANASGGNFTLTLPLCSTASGQLLFVTKTDTSGFYITIAANAADLISGSASQILDDPLGSIILTCSGGTSWDVF